MVPDATLYPFNMKGMQFPIQPAPAITCNKFQGPTLEKIGIYHLPTNMFTHGQYYIANSRVGSGTALRILTESNN